MGDLEHAQVGRGGGAGGGETAVPSASPFSMAVLASFPTRWSCPPYSVASAERLSAALGLSSVVAAVLVRRGLDTPERAAEFLRGEERGAAADLPGVHEAVGTILGHVERGSPIVVHGDYDVDGVCSTAVLVHALRRLGAQPRWLLPSRSEDGYGLTSATVARMAAQGAGLVLAVDCGVTSVAEVAEAQSLGMDVVVCDHHRPGPELPACPVVHPALGAYPYPDLCATAVAHKLAEVLASGASFDPAAGAEDLDLVALATVADLVPLRGENRRLVREGLEVLARTAKPGLRALMRISGVDRGRLDEHALGFRLGPRINAAGRIRRADAALELLLTEDEDRAAAVADELDLLNRERQDTETRILFAAESARAERPDAAACVVSGEGWHPGVIGIVASRLVERHHRPCVVVALDGDRGRGSGRSIGPYDLHAGLVACAEHLGRYGGHRMAAGLEIDADRVEPFAAALSAHAGSVLAPDDLVAEQRVDAVVPGGALGLELAEDLARLAPFGMGNPRPTLLVPAARLGDLAPMGRDGAHARLSVSSGGARARAVAFGTTPRALAAETGDEPRHVAFTLEAREWNGAVEPRLVLKAVCPAEPGQCRVLDGPQEALGPALERALAERRAGSDDVRAHFTSGPTRALRDHRGQGIAGVAGALLSSGEEVLLVCADASRRRAGLEKALGGLCRASRPAPLSAVSWPALHAAPDLARPFPHLVAVDPPPTATGEVLLAEAPSEHDGALAHLAWGAPEAGFTLAAARAELDLEATLRLLYRELRGAGEVAGAALEALLRGDGAHPRSTATCVRLLSVLAELGLVEVGFATGGPACRLGTGERTSLERSATYRESRRMLAEAESYLVSQGAVSAKHQRTAEPCESPARAKAAARLPAA
jgi:single-stranded-DNA-specific exonuclease